MTTQIDIYFSKLPTADQVINKAVGMIGRSKVALTSVVLSHKGEEIELTKDKQTKQWLGRGRLVGVTPDQIITRLK